MTKIWWCSLSLVKRAANIKEMAEEKTGEAAAASTSSSSSKAWSMESVLKRVRTRVLRVGAGVVLLGVGGTALTYASLVQKAKLKPHGFFLDFNLDEASIVESSVEASGGASKQLDALFSSRKTLTVRSVTEALAKAKDDDRCKGLLLRSSGSYGHNAFLQGSIATMATMQEIRSALSSFSENKSKLSYASFGTFGELGSADGLKAYTLASAMRSIYLQPSGHLSIMGMGSRTIFFKGLLQKLKIEPYVVKRNQYKNALNNLTEDGYTRGHREATDHILSTLFEQCVHDISLARGLDPRQVKKCIDNAPLSADEALTASLISRVAFVSDVEEEVKQWTRERIEKDSPGAMALARRSSKASSGGAKGKEGVSVKLEQYVQAMQAQEVLDRMWEPFTRFQEWREKALESLSGGNNLNPDTFSEKKSGIALVYASGPILNGASDGSSGGGSINSSSLSQLLQ